MVRPSLPLPSGGEDCSQTSTSACGELGMGCLLLLPTVHTSCSYFLRLLVYLPPVPTSYIYILYLLPVPTFCTYLLYLLPVPTSCTYLQYHLPVPTSCTYPLYLPLLPTSGTYLLYLPPAPVLTPSSADGVQVLLRPGAPLRPPLPTQGADKVTSYLQTSLNWSVKKTILTFRLKFPLCLCFFRQISSKVWLDHVLPRILWVWGTINTSAMIGARLWLVSQYQTTALKYLHWIIRQRGNIDVNIKCECKTHARFKRSICDNNIIFTMVIWYIGCKYLLDQQNQITSWI